MSISPPAGRENGQSAMIVQRQLNKTAAALAAQRCKSLIVLCLRRIAARGRKSRRSLIVQGKQWCSDRCRSTQSFACVAAHGYRLTDPSTSLSPKTIQEELTTSERRFPMAKNSYSLPWIVVLGNLPELRASDRWLPQLGPINEPKLAAYSADHRRRSGGLRQARGHVVERRS